MTGSHRSDTTGATSVEMTVTVGNQASGEWMRFDELAHKLVLVPKAEIDEKRRRAGRRTTATA